jgi:cytochrome c oxidase accessory protein FixG
MSSTEIPSQPSTIVTGGGRRWIYPTEILGRWQRWRNASSLLLLVVLYATPWLKIGGEPFLKLSFLSSSFVMFGSHILIYEFYHFAFLALLLVVTLFLASALYGRIWCGYACPQTVFIEQILGRIDRLFEGPASTRLANHGRPMTWQRWLRRIGKQATYVLVAASFSFTLVAIFTGPEFILAGESKSALGAVALLTLIAWFDAAYWREQFCHIVCPYARFQGVMQDQATRTIGYDQARGEPRGRAKQSSGDCIDCGLCVRVCPSGIDIRQGATQLECVACARCVDACDGVMENLGRDPGLIRYDAVAVFEEVSSPAQSLSKPKILRPRVILYAAAWLVIFTVGLVEFIRRAPFHVNMIPVPGSKPWFAAGDRIQNILTLKVGNQSAGSMSFKIALTPTAEEQGLRIESPRTLGPLKPGQEMSIPLLISAGQGFMQGSDVGLIVLTEDSNYQLQLTKKWVGPSN